MKDADNALHAACLRAFPDAKLLACYYHLQHNRRKKFPHSQTLRKCLKSMYFSKGEQHFLEIFDSIRGHLPERELI